MEKGDAPLRRADRIFWGRRCCRRTYADACRRLSAGSALAVPPASASSAGNVLLASAHGSTARAPGPRQHGTEQPCVQPFEQLARPLETRGRAPRTQTKMIASTALARTSRVADQQPRGPSRAPGHNAVAWLISSAM